MGSIVEQYPVVFGEAKRPYKPHSEAIKDFQRKWNWQKTLYELANEEIEKVGKVSQMYLTTVLQYISYLTDKSIAEELEDEFQDRIRQQKQQAKRRY